MGLARAFSFDGLPFPTKAAKVVFGWPVNLGGIRRLPNRSPLELVSSTAVLEVILEGLIWKSASGAGLLVEGLIDEDPLGTKLATIEDLRKDWLEALRVVLEELLSAEYVMLLEINSIRLLERAGVDEGELEKLPVAFKELVAPKEGTFVIDLDPACKETELKATELPSFWEGDGEGRDADLESDIFGLDSLNVAAWLADSLWEADVVILSLPSITDLVSPAVNTSEALSNARVTDEAIDKESVGTNVPVNPPNVMLREGDVVRDGDRDTVRANCSEVDKVIVADIETVELLLFVPLCENDGLELPENGLDWVSVHVDPPVTLLEVVMLKESEAVPERVMDEVGIWFWLAEICSELEIDIVSDLEIDSVTI